MDDPSPSTYQLLWQAIFDILREDEHLAADDITELPEFDSICGTLTSVYLAGALFGADYPRHTKVVSGDDSTARILGNCRALGDKIAERLVE